MKTYNNFNPSGCLVSEKYDGIGAQWDGRQLTSRDGNRFDAPTWFTSDLPNESLDGELWCGRGQFEVALGVCQSAANDSRWSQMRFMIFDQPRTYHLGACAEIVQRCAVSNRDDLDKLQHSIVSNGGEGVVIRDSNGVDWKYKPFDDEDAVIIDHVPGKGRARIAACT